LDRTACEKGEDQGQDDAANARLILSAPRFNGFGVCKARIVPAKRIQFSIRPDDVRAAAINAIFVPRQRVHERFDEQPECMRLVQFKFLEQLTERFGFAAALHEVFEPVADLVLQKILHLREINEVAHRTHLPADFQEVTDGRAIRVPTRQRREIVEAQLPARLSNGSEDDVGGVQAAESCVRNPVASAWFERASPFPNPSFGLSTLDGETRPLLNTG